MTTLFFVILICFIGVGLPDSVLGTAWPVIYRELNLPISLAGYITSTVSACTIISSLVSARAIKKFGVGGVTAISTVMTAAALFAYAIAPNPIYFFVAAIPLGLGAGSIDTALNNFVALHFSAAKMSFLHCFYGLGVAVSPYIIASALGADNNWRKGYIIIASIQSIISVIAIAALPFWRKCTDCKAGDDTDSEIKILSVRQMMRMPKARVSAFAFLTSCATELTAGGWCSSYFCEAKGIKPGSAAQITMMFYIGMTAGRFFSGIFSKKLGRRRIIAISAAIVFVSLVTLVMNLSAWIAAAALFLLGLGIGPIFPNLSHLTPSLFGRDISGAIMGFQQTAAYIGIMAMPWLFGVLAQRLSTAIFPFYLLILFSLYIVSLVQLFKKSKN